MYADFALPIAAGTLTFMGDYFNYTYPLIKLGLIEIKVTF